MKFNSKALCVLFSVAILPVCSSDNPLKRLASQRPGDNGFLIAAVKERTAQVQRLNQQYRDLERQNKELKQKNEQLAAEGQEMRCMLTKILESNNSLNHHNLLLRNSVSTMSRISAALYSLISFLDDKLAPERLSPAEVVEYLEHDWQLYNVHQDFFNRNNPAIAVRFFELVLQDKSFSKPMSEMAYFLKKHEGLLATVFHYGCVGDTLFNGAVYSDTYTMGDDGTIYYVDPSDVTETADGTAQLKIERISIIGEEETYIQFDTPIVIDRGEVGLYVNEPDQLILIFNANTIKVYSFTGEDLGYAFARDETTFLPNDSERLFEGILFHDPKDKKLYKVGISLGQKGFLRTPITTNAKDFTQSWISPDGTIFSGTLEPKEEIEDAKERVKLYCVREFDNTRVYSFDNDGSLGFTLCEEQFDNFCSSYEYKAVLKVVSNDGYQYGLLSIDFLDSDGESERITPFMMEDEPLHVAISQKGNYIGVIAADNRVYIFSEDNGQLSIFHRFDTIGSFGHDGVKMKWLDNSTLLINDMHNQECKVISIADNSAYVWNLTHFDDLYDVYTVPLKNELIILFQDGRFAIYKLLPLQDYLQKIVQ